MTNVDTKTAHIMVTRFRFRPELEKSILLRIVLDMPFLMGEVTSGCGLVWLRDLLEANKRTIINP